MSADNFAVIPDMQLLPASSSCAVPAAVLAIPLLFSPHFRVEVDSPQYDFYYNKFLQLCVFVSAVQGAILSVSCNTTTNLNTNENYYDDKDGIDNQDDESVSKGQADSSSDIDSIASIEEEEEGKEVLANGKHAVEVEVEAAREKRGRAPRSLKYVCVLNAVDHFGKYNELIESSWFRESGDFKVPYFSSDKYNIFLFRGKSW